MVVWFDACVCLFSQDACLDEFEEKACTITYKLPCLILISNVTGKPMTTAPTANYWRSHLRGCVQFYTGLQSMSRLGITGFVEIGPQPTLIGMVKSAGLVSFDPHFFLESMNSLQGSVKCMSMNLAKLFVTDCTLHLQAMFDPLFFTQVSDFPTYSWEHPMLGSFKPGGFSVSSVGCAGGPGYISVALGYKSLIPNIAIEVYANVMGVVRQPLLAQHVVMATPIVPAAYWFCAMVVFFSFRSGLDFFSPFIFVSSFLRLLT